MTIFSSTFSLRAEERAPESWRLQDAKARFSEVVRLAHQAGPQRVTVHGRQAVVVVDAAEFDRLQGDRRHVEGGAGDMACRVTRPAGR